MRKRADRTFGPDDEDSNIPPAVGAPDVTSLGPAADRTRIVRSPWRQPLLVLAFAWQVMITGCTSSQRASSAAPASGPRCFLNQRVTLPSGTLAFDVYLPAHPSPAPLVVVAHGFGRSKANMSGWGRRLAEEGFVVAVPTLPTWSDHPRNGMALNQLMVWLCERSAYAERIRHDRLAMVGFSAGGLSSLLAAADNPAVRVWVGLDPVDRHQLGVVAANRLKARAAILRAEPSPCNAQGNAAAIEQALGSRCQTVHIPGAVHVDAEWPTDWAAELACGASDAQRRERFVQNTVTVLRSALQEP